ncbi:MAG: hypothetical protein L6Q37_05025, partial [Bdellovibrionaceae bacterium]|nr:hypothetical protein [Pseudobdellovibrionaceae bacterium]
MFRVALFLVISFFSTVLLAISFEGTWKTSCVNGQQKIQVIKTNRIATFEVFFQDYQCQNLSFYFLNQGKFELSLKNSRVKGSTEGEIEFIFDSVGFNIFNPQIEFQFNQQQICGYEDWKLKKIKNITGQQCRFFSAAKIS